MLGNGFFDEVFVFRFGGCLENKGWVGGCILGFVFFHRGKITCVGYDGGVFFKLIEMVVFVG